MKNRVPTRYCRLRFDDLIVDDHNRAAIQAVRAWLLEEGPAVWLQGPPGTGKTATLCAGIETLAAEGKWRDGAYIPSVDYYVAKHRKLMRLKDPREYWDQQNDIECINSASLLILDDLTPDVVPSAWERGLVMELIDYRYRNVLSTSVATNHDETGMAAAWGERIVSRLREMCVVVRMGGPDRRRHS